MISKEDIKYTAELCKLNMTEEEIEDFREDFTKVLEHADQLKTVDTEGMEPTYHISSEIQRLREDVVEESMSREDTIKNAPEEQYGYFKLLRVMD